MSKLPTADPFFGEVISVYTRAQALADGVLIDAGPMAREVGFRWHVAITAAAWEDCVAWTDPDSQRQVHQDQTGRLWDVLFMAAFAVRSAPGSATQVSFELDRVPRAERAREAERTTLKLIVGPGDAGEPVMTILQPQED